MDYEISESYGILLVTELVDTQIYGLLQVMDCHKPEYGVDCLLSSQILLTGD